MSGIATAIAGSAIVGAVASTAAGKSQAKAANKAADAQVQAAQIADESQRYFYDTTRADNMPIIQRGNAAGNQLAMLLGLDVPYMSIGGAGGSGGTAAVGAGPNPLMGVSYVDMSGGVPRPNMDLYNTNEAYRNAWDSEVARHQGNYGTGYTRASDPNEIQKDIANLLRPEIDRINSENEANQAAQSESMRSNPLFGSLNKQFTEQDFWNDPGTKLGFQFGMDEGTKALNRQAAAAGGLNSGATLKALTRYATDYTGTKYGDAWNRDQAFKTNQFNRLASLAGVGQSAVNTVGAAGQNAGNRMANNALYSGNAQANAATAVGNARANSAIGIGNSLNSALGFGANYLMNNGSGGFGYSGAGSLFGGAGSNPVTGLAGGATYGMGANYGFGG